MICKICGEYSGASDLCSPHVSEEIAAIEKDKLTTELVSLRAELEKYKKLDKGMTAIELEESKKMVEVMAENKALRTNLDIAVNGLKRIKDELDFVLAQVGPQPDVKK